MTGPMIDIRPTSKRTAAMRSPLPVDPAAPRAPRPSLVTRALSDRSGVSAIEFAIIAPVLMLFYFACVEISMLLTVDRKVTNVASAVGDLVAQDDMVDSAEMLNIFNAAKAIMEPYPSGGVRMRVTSLQMQPDNSVRVRWSRGKGMGAMACGATVAVPAGILTPGQSVVMAEVATDYSSPIGQFVTSSYVLDDTFYLRPRRSVEVAFDPAPCP